MIQGWKQRLYAFLLRQILGPYLDQPSIQKLHDSIEFSFQEGTYVLKDIGLNSNELTERLSSEGLSIRKAKIQRLEIRLRLQENNNNNTRDQDSVDDDGGSSRRRGGGGTAATKTSSSSSSSLAWRAMKLGSTDSSTLLPAVSLVAEIIVDGVELEIEPCRTSRRRHPRPTTQTSSTEDKSKPQKQQEQQSPPPSSKSIIGSYVDAALASLRLTFKATNISVKLVMPPQPNHEYETWVAITMSSISFHDLETNPTTTGTSNKKVMSKLIEVYEISIQAGETYPGNAIQNNRQSTLALAEGMAQIYVRIMEHKNKKKVSPSAPSSGNDDDDKDHQQHLPMHVEQDFEIKLNQQLNFSVDPASILRIQCIADAFRSQRGIIDDEDRNNDTDSPINKEPEYEETTLANIPTRQTTTDEEDLHAISGIMRQYREAYHLAEQNQLQRGMLVPSSAYLNSNDDDNEGVMVAEEDDTWDVFFDANDQSFYNAASVLMQSVHNLAASTEGLSCSAVSGSGNATKTVEDQGDTINTTIRLDLSSACLKIVFRDPKAPITPSPLEEYMLLTMNDFICNASTTTAHLGESQLSLNISHLQVEDAHLDKTKSASGGGFMSVGGLPVFEGNIEIGSLLEFVETNGDDNSYENDLIVSQAPCIAFAMRKSNPNANQNVFECEIEMLPVELFYRQRTISNLSRFSSHLQEGKMQSQRPAVSRAASKSDCDNADEAENRQLTKFRCSCPFINFLIPLPTILSSGDIQPIFDRCGQVANGVPIRRSCLGIHIEQIEIEWQDEYEVIDGDTFPSEAGGTLSCHHFFVFASAPVGDRVSMLDSQQMQQTDIFLATGRLEIDPITPISVQFKRNFPGLDGENVGKDSFPIVPSLSTFKARQEDEDEDMKIDKLLFSKLQDVDADSRKELRGSDPQLQMMTEAEKCDSVIILNIPEIIVDLTKTEIETLAMVLNSLALSEVSKEQDPSAISASKADAPQHDPEAQSIGISTNISQISISIRESSDDDNLTKDKLLSFLLAIDELRMHVIHDGGGLKQARFLALEPCLYTGMN